MHESGFSWLAGIALFFWALQRRLYLLAAVSLVYGAVGNILAPRFGLGFQAAAFALQVVVFGALANPLHRWLLDRRGWRITAEEPETTPGKAA